MDAAAKSYVDIFSALPDLRLKVFVWQDMLKDIQEEHGHLKQDVKDAVDQLDRLTQVVSSCESLFSVRKKLKCRSSSGFERSVWDLS